MTAPPSESAPSPLLELRPARHPEIVVGPGLARGPRVLHLIKDRRVNRSYEVGAKEHFVISRLDGEQTLGEIGAQYAGRFGRRLGEPGWRQLLGLLSARRLLVGNPPPEPAPEPEPAAEPEKRRRGYRPMGTDLVFGDPSALLGRMYRWLRHLYAPYVLIPLLAVVIAMEVVLAARIPELLHQAHTLWRHPDLAMIVVGLLWLSSGLHELAHGLTSYHFGGGASEVGLRWRPPMAYLYCKTEDTMLFGPRRQRIATAAAGVVANLVFLLPFFPLWMWFPPDDVTRDSLAALLLFGSLRGLVNYLPVPNLDGYVMLSHALNVTDLSTESYRYARLFGRRLLGRGDETGPYPRRMRIIHLCYAVGSVLLAAALTAGVLWLIVLWTPEPYGRYIAGGLLAVVLVGALGRAVVTRVLAGRARRAAQAAAG
ncbi:M50 family metallopeptidase [Streptomyces sp. NPDC057654]|uniref:M50 family metallopeptidase n=1 Tax=Streptomyces sp. NPDC057654 TaxID=3346196 RepID=UPI00368E6925